MYQFYLENKYLLICILILFFNLIVFLFQEFLEDDASVLDEEDDGVGCPLPSTPVEQSLLETEVTIVKYRY